MKRTSSTAGGLKPEMHVEHRLVQPGLKPHRTRECQRANNANPPSLTRLHIDGASARSKHARTGYEWEGARGWSAFLSAVLRLQQLTQLAVYLGAADQSRSRVIYLRI